MFMFRCSFGRYVCNLRVVSPSHPALFILLLCLLFTAGCQRPLLRQPVMADDGPESSDSSEGVVLAEPMMPAPETLTALSAGTVPDTFIMVANLPTTPQRSVHFTIPKRCVGEDKAATKRRTEWIGLRLAAVSTSLYESAILDQPELEPSHLNVAFHYRGERVQMDAANSFVMYVIYDFEVTYESPGTPLPVDPSPMTTAI